MFEAFDEVSLSAVTEVVAITEAVEKGDEVSDEVTENKGVDSYTKRNCALTKMVESNRFYFAEFRMCKMWRYWESSNREQYWIQEKGDTRNKKVNNLVEEINILEKVATENKIEFEKGKLTMTEPQRVTLSRKKWQFIGVIDIFEKVCSNNREQS